MAIGASDWATGSTSSIAIGALNLAMGSTEEGRGDKLYFRIKKWMTYHMCTCTGPCNFLLGSPKYKHNTFGSVDLYIVIFSVSV